MPPRVSMLRIRTVVNFVGHSLRGIAVGLPAPACCLLRIRAGKRDVTSVGSADAECVSRMNKGVAMTESSELLPDVPIYGFIGAFRSHSVDEPESVFNEPTLLPSSMIEMSRYSPCLLLTATTQKLSRNDFGTKAASAIE